MSCMLEIDDLSYTYPGGPEALRGVTLHVRAGGRVALVGPNGAGKSTLLVATHDLELALELCDRAVVMDGGAIVADGAPRELLANATLMEAHGLEVPASLR